MLYAVHLCMNENITCKFSSDVIDDLKKRFFSRAWYLPSMANTTLYRIPKDIYTSDGEKVEKLRIGKKYPLYQPIRSREDSHS